MCAKSYRWPLQKVYTKDAMIKRSLGTIVLFVLLVLTVVALTQLDAKDTSAFKPNSPASYETN
jgi:hypothetical protein